MDDQQSVYLHHAGEKKINVIKVIREHTGTGLAEAKALSETVGVIAAGLSPEAAATMVRELTAAGASAGLDGSVAGPAAHVPEFGRLPDTVRASVSGALEAEEIVRVVVPGSNDHALVGTDTRLFVCTPAASAWPYRSVTGIEVDKGLFKGSVRVLGTGVEMPVSGGWGSVKAGVARLDVLRVATPSSAPRTVGASATASGGAAPSGSVADELTKLVALRDAGDLTEAEYAALKARLLQP